VSNGAWPGAGNVDHPLGGYALPGTYTITLTVTDLLGATGTAEQQVEIIDCTVDDLEAFVGCGGSGVWHTANGGLSWEERGGGVLEGVVVHDLKVHPFTLGTGEYELWAATAKGLYKSVDSAASWERLVLPDPDGGDDEPTAASIVCSTEEPDEVYVLAYKTVPSNRVWLYRTTDKGETWTWIQFGSTQTPEVVVGNVYPNFSSGRKFVEYNGDLICAGIFRRDDVTETWTQIGAGNLDWHAAVTVDAANRLWEVGDRNDAAAEAYWGTPGAWNAVNVRGSGCSCVWPLVSGQVAIGFDQTFWGVAWYTAGVRDTYSSLEYNQDCVYQGWDLKPTFIYETLDGELFVGVHDPLDYGAILHYARDCLPWLNQHGWWVEHSTAPDDYIIPCIFEHGGRLWATRGTFATGLPHLLYRSPGGTWSEHEVAFTPGVFCGKTHGGQMWIGGGRYVAYLTAGRYITVYSVPVGRSIIDIFHHDNDWFAFCSNGEVYKLGEYDGAVSPSTIGRTHLMSMSADGYFVYVALLDGTGKPIIFRVVYDLESMMMIYNTGTGTWGGVKTDCTNSARVWVFGDFGAASKVLYSDDWGDNWTDVTDGSWAANEVVRPVLPSVYDPSDTIAILNTALDAWHTGDTGAVWTKTGDIAFACHCGERDWMEERNLFIGRLAAGANHLQFSPNRGVGWLERSGGFQPNAPVTALQIVS